MTPTLQLYEDTFANDGALSAPLPARARMVFVVHGSASIGDRELKAGEAWFGEDAVMLHPGAEGVTCWRWDLARDHVPGLAAGRSLTSVLKLAAPLATLPQGELLWRGDSVGFPPGGCAYRHTHRGPGIRCLLDGGIRIDTHGHSTSYGPGGAWYESGPEPVFAQAALDRPSRFIRVMILPRELIGKSSIRYVDEADKDKPRSQQYQIFVDTPFG